MSPRLARRRSGVVALTCAGLTLSAGALSALGSTANANAPLAPSADPVADCAEPFPVAEVAKGDLVDGLTVVSGTEPVEFTGEVLGVLNDGIAADIDMIMIDLDMEAFDETGGVWQGMSGSPVYAADGRLIGAVAYGLSWGPSKIAGITPFEHMDDYFTADPDTRKAGLSKAQARLVADRAGVTTQQAAQGFRELPMPLGVAGLSARRLEQAQKRGPKFLDKNTYVLGRAGADAPGPETIVAGGNLAASAAYGDITFAGVGTATSVCNGEVVGFGHPLYQLGETTEGLHPADAIFVQPDSLGSPFKVANISPVAGTITQDRLTGITGTFGPAPSSSTITSTVTKGSTSRTGVTEVTVQDALPDATFYALLTNSDRVLGGNPRGSALQTWTVAGDDNGRPFQLTFTDRYTGGDLVWEPIFQLADLVWNLAYIDGVTVESVTADNNVTDSLDTHGLGVVEQKAKGVWTRITPKAPGRIKAGKTLRLRMTVNGSAGESTLRIPNLAIPKEASGRSRLAIRGGNSSYSWFYGRSVSSLEKQLAEAVRHDQIKVELSGRSIGATEESAGGRRGPRPSEEEEMSSFSLERVLGPLAAVADGRKRIPVRITK
ncbi:SpoIVB peptidase S55 domain-containing protein [Nocardioides sp.]|uniref:SpoIVB peptidase S55 domain-containing protein n=1 Tax=Nocardioides sp. TaxID=35761 RepID=UPI002B27B521|nr:SpoIVB peptidase S55 domain-containing protein [Nocardioides sp.]